MCGWAIGALVASLVASAPSGTDAPALVHAAPTEGRAASPRRLFNMGLAAEEQGDGLAAVARYMAARAVPRTSFADSLYARGAGLRLIRLLAGRDDDAAAAVATALAQDDGPGPGTELSPLVRSLLAHVERDLLSVQGILVSVRLDAQGGTDLVVVDAGGVAHSVHAIAPVHPFTAGDSVRFLARRVGQAAAHLVAMARSEVLAWRLLEVQTSELVKMPQPQALSGRKPAPKPS